MGKLPGMSSVEIQALGYRLSELEGVINLNPYQNRRPPALIEAGWLEPGRGLAPRLAPARLR